MCTYRIGNPIRRTAIGGVPHSVVCEECEEELEGAAEVQRGQERFSGITTAGLIRLWPKMEKSVKLHESRCRGRFR